jgi:GNAT superfamily N-acetyltransferase
MLLSRPPYTLSDDSARLDFETVFRFISVESYWAKGVPREVQRRAIENSLNFGIYHDGGAMVGFARVVTDRATFAWICDVYIDAEHRGLGLSKWLMESIIAHPDLQGLRRLLLATWDAHGLYAQFGFTPLARPDRWMNLHHPDVYKRGDEPT